MGVDLEMRIKTKAPLTEDQRIDLEYHMRHRFREILWSADSDYEWAKVCPATEWDEEKGDSVEVGGNLYEIPVWCRWYGKDYERGPAMAIYGLARFLKQHKLVEQVLIGNDHQDDYEEVTDNLLEDLLCHFLRFGNLPYSRAFDQDSDGPTCCGHKMIRCGWGGNFAKWYCGGCGKTAVRRDGITTFTKQGEDE